MNIKKALLDDLPKILDLQKQAYLSEAKLVNDFLIQPLTQTLEELENEFLQCTILKFENDQNEVIGSVRFYEKNNRVYVGKLMVHPDFQNQGIGTQLLKAPETFCKSKTFELFTSSKSEKNIRLYKKLGYKEFKRETISVELEFVFMEKIISSQNA
jgi:ribosomal protein S18 acetylase RimI-like enzyme